MSVIAQTFSPPVATPTRRKERQEPQFLNDGTKLSDQEINHRPGKKVPAKLEEARQGLPFLSPALSGEVLVLMEDLKRNWLTALVMSTLVLGSLGLLVRMDYMNAKERFALQENFQSCLAKLHAWDMDPTQLASLKIDPQRFWQTNDVIEMRRQSDACQNRLEEVKQAIANSAQWPDWNQGSDTTPAATADFGTVPPATAPTRFLAS